VTEEMLQKIKKLHVKAESCKKIGSQAEAEAFAAMVNQLLIKHNLDLADLNWEQREAQDHIEQVWVSGIPTRHQRQEWSERLTRIIANAHFCRLFIRTGSNQIAFVGHQSNRQVAEYLYVTMYRLAGTMSNDAYVKYFYECKYRGDVTQARGFRNSWLYGFMTRLQERFDAERKTASATSSSTALIKINQTHAMVDQWIKDKVKPRMAHAVHRRVSNPEGVERGKRAARNVNLRPVRAIA
jgi:hypothetical protein